MPVLVPAADDKWLLSETCKPISDSQHDQNCSSGVGIDDRVISSDFPAEVDDDLVDGFVPETPRKPFLATFSADDHSVIATAL